MNAHFRYVIVLCGALLAAGLPCVLLNYRIGEVSWANADMPQAASAWQNQQRQGIVAIAPGQEHNLKFLTLNRQLPNIDAVVLGSSTVLSIVPADLAPLGTTYNFATRGSQGWRTIAEADYFASSVPEVRWLIVSLDQIQLQTAVPPAEVEMRLKRISVPARIRDAVTLPRIADLSATVVGWVRAPDPIRAIAATLNPTPSESYRCEGLLTRNFAVPAGTCGGYRWDGSIVSVGYPAETPEQYRQMLSSLQDTDYYRRAIADAGLPNAEYLQHLAAAARVLRSRGGGLIGLLPPVLPGIERGVLQSELAPASLKRRKTVLDEWGQHNGVVVIDAAASERFGCTFDEFHDEIHSFFSCDDKVFARFWRDRPGPGRYAPEIDAMSSIPQAGGVSH